METSTINNSHEDFLARQEANGRKPSWIVEEMKAEAQRIKKASDSCCNPGFGRSPEAAGESPKDASATGDRRKI